VLPDDDKRYAIETCKRSESVLKWFKVNNFILIHNIQYAFVGYVIFSESSKCTVQQ
jgi:hypothetical protein